MEIDCFNDIETRRKIRRKRIREQCRVYNAFYNDYIEEIHNASVCRAEMPQFNTFRLFAESGNRLAYEEQYFGLRRKMCAYAMMLLLEESHKSDLENIIWSICDMYTWALPAHLDYNEKASEYPFVLDLFNCETGFALAEIVFIFDDILTKTLKERVLYEIKRRVTEPYSNRIKENSWETRGDNRSAVCAGSIGSILLLLSDNKNRLITDLERINNTMKCYIDGFGTDGSCIEGIDYWTYGMTYYMSYFDLLKEITGVKLCGKERLFKIGSFLQNTFCDGNISLPFSDSCGSRFRYGLSCSLYNECDGIIIPDLNDAMRFNDDGTYRFNAILRDFICDNRYETGETSGSFVYPEAQWYIYKNKSVFYAIKGGNNDEPHNHNDVGSFALAIKGKWILCDIGAGEYTRDYFSEKRYDIFCNSSFSHNVPIIDGKGQSWGKNKKASYFEANENTVNIEFSEAYDIQYLTSMSRKAQLDEQRSSLIITDIFKFSCEAHEIRERFITQNAPIIVKNGAMIDKTVVSANENCTVTVGQHTYTDHFGSSRKIYSIDFVYECSEKAKLIFRIENVE